MATTDAIAAVCPSFLGINVVEDTDQDAYGPKSSGLPMKSTFRVYDLIGRVKETNDVLKVRKYMVFVFGKEFTAGHFFQNTDFARAYVVAYLHRQVNSALFYDSFLKTQQIPQSINLPDRLYFQQYENTQKTAIAHFNGQDIRLAGIKPVNVTATIVTSYVDDNFSPHDAKMLKIGWDRSKAPGKFSSTRVELLLKAPIGVLGVSFLSFRVARNYPGSPSGPSFDMRVALNGGQGVRISDYGNMIHYPIPTLAPDGATQPEQTKTAMKTILIPVADFGIGQSSVSLIVFDFSVNLPSAEAKAVFYLSTIEFTL